MSKKSKAEESTVVEVVATPAETTPPAPQMEKPSLKTTYRDLFAKEASRLSGSKFEGDPTMEAANGHPLLLKYYQNWLNCEAE